MARKPPEQLSAAYARRLARAAAQGKTRQEARGHRAGEHVVRKQGGARALTPVQRRDAERLAAAVKGKRGEARAAAAAEEARLAKRRERDRQRHAGQREREQWTGQLTDKDKRYARRIGRAWHSKLGLEPREAGEAGVARMGRIGPERFRYWVKHNRAAYRQYIKEVNEGTYESRGEALLEMWAEEDGEPITMWLYYHSYS